MKNHRTRNLIALWAKVMVLTMMIGCSGSDKKAEAESDYAGVQIGVITYSWRSMPSSPEDIINYCKQTGISSLELMGNIAESFAGAPEGPAFPQNFRELSDEEREQVEQLVEGIEDDELRKEMEKFLTKQMRLLKAEDGG